MKISQCMIVKNEEQNIERALSWGKGIVHEQIVVDTGSTDRTVEIAKKMGADVYHFTWINDFAAAKNFAIEKATGDWIAFLDADEYFTEEDAKKLPEIIKELSMHEICVGNTKRYCNVIKTLWVQLGSHNEIIGTPSQTRIFRNLPFIRYIGSIHEQIDSLSEEPLIVADLKKQLSIYHTGYAWTEESKEQKSRRNLELLEKELEQHPDSAALQIYFAESLLAAEKLEDALHYAIQASENPDRNFSPARRSSAFQSVLYTMYDLHKGSDEYEDSFFSYYKKAVDFDGCCPDFDIAAGFWCYAKEDYEHAIEYFESALNKGNTLKEIGSSRMPVFLKEIYAQLAASYDKLKNPTRSFSNAVHALELDRYQENMIYPVVRKLSDDTNSSEKEIISFLKKLYDFSSQKDILFLLKIIKKVTNPELEEELKQYLSEENRNLLYPERKQIKRDIPIQTAVDADFFQLMETILNTTLNGLQHFMKDNLLALQKENPEFAGTVILNYNYWGFWGTIDMDMEIPELIEQRSRLLKDRMDEFIELYRSLCDHRSRRTLLGILENWINFSRTPLQKITDVMNEQYFDPDLFLCDEQSVIVDLGAYRGDTYQSFIRVYGETSYQTYYCFEALPENVEHLEQNLAGKSGVVIRGKAVSDCKGVASFQINKDFPSTNKLSDSGELQIETVTLDDDIKEKITLLKMDIEGAEYQALLGARQHIQNDHPILAISVYHSNEDILRIPRKIHDFCPDYRFYLRYTGGQIYPSEYVLIAVPGSQQL